MIKKLTYTAIGISLYVTLSMVLKIPVIGHIGLDLGYIVLAIYCMRFGAISGAIVGAIGCAFVSLIMSGWFPPGWFVGNLVIGLICGKLYTKGNMLFNIALTGIAVIFGILVIKTVIECYMFSIPFIVKIPKNAIAAIMDIFVMWIGLFVNEKIVNYK